MDDEDLYDELYGDDDDDAIPTIPAAPPPKPAFKAPPKVTLLAPTLAPAAAVPAEIPTEAEQAEATEGEAEPGGGEESDDDDFDIALDEPDEDADPDDFKIMLDDNVGDTVREQMYGTQQQWDQQQQHEGIVGGSGGGDAGGGAAAAAQVQAPAAQDIHYRSKTYVRPGAAALEAKPYLGRPGSGGGGGAPPPPVPPAGKPSNIAAALGGGGGPPPPVPPPGRPSAGGMHTGAGQGGPAGVPRDSSLAADIGGSGGGGPRPPVPPPGTPNVPRYTGAPVQPPPSLQMDSGEWNTFNRQAPNARFNERGQRVLPGREATGARPPCVLCTSLYASHRCSSLQLNS